MSSSEVNDNFDTIYDEFNGSIDSTNLANSAITTAKLADGSVTAAKLADGLIDSGWVSLNDTPETVTNNGNRSYDLVFNSTDLTDTVSEGMRIRATRTVSAQTQCADLESGSSQYFSKATPTGLGQTDDITVMGWLKLESYGGTRGLISTANGTTNGWNFYIDTSGAIVFGGARAADDYATSYQSVPLSKWIHIAATLDSSGAASTMYMDGVSIPLAYTNGGNAALAATTSNLVIGATNGAAPTNFFDGKLEQVAIFSSVLSAATIRSYMSQTLTGAESTCVGFWSLNNTLNDGNANANNLTANGGALATNVDSPFGNYLGGTLEYGIITKTAFSTNTTLTVQVPEGCTIPTSGGVSAVAYSTQKAPYGFPSSRNKWCVDTVVRTRQSTSPAANVWTNLNFTLTIPVGDWHVGYQSNAIITHAGASLMFVALTLSTGSTTESDSMFTAKGSKISASLTEVDTTLQKNGFLSLSSATIHYLNIASNTASSAVYIGEADTPTSPGTLIRAELALL